MSSSRPISDGDQFGLANIPFGVVSTAQDPIPRIATRLNDQVFTLPDLIENGLLDHLDQDIKSSLSQVGDCCFSHFRWASINTDADSQL